MRSFKEYLTIKPTIKFSNNPFTLSYNLLYGNYFYLSLHFGSYNICSIEERELFTSYKKTYRFYFALKLLYAEVGETKVNDILVNHKLLNA